MPRRINKPPEVMTWAKAMPILVISAIFDVLRLFSANIWFFGPAFATLYCTAKASGAIGTTAAGFLCSTVAGGIGYVGSPAFATFGIMLAMVVGFFGWLTATFAILATDRRVLGENPFAVLWLFEGLGASILVMVWGVYRTQIKKEQEILKKYTAENASTQIQERQQRAAEFMQAQGAQANQAQQQEAMQEEMTAEKQAENEASADTPAGVLRFPSERVRKTAVGKQNIPDELRRAA